MKYIVLVVVILLIVLAKPWESSFAGRVYFFGKDSTLIPPATPRVQLLAINQVINNEISELPETKKFDKIVENFMRAWDLKGVSFALMKDDKLIYSKGYGFADQEAGIEADASHIFRVASVSKLITATGIMKLVEDEKLQLSDHVFGPQGILSDSCYSEIKDPRCRQITVEHLLRHQGGFSIAYGDPMFCPIDVAQKMNVTPPADLTTMIRFSISRRLRFNPGQGTCYSNIGYGMLSKVIEKITGMSYENYIKEYILTPAGCSDIHLGYNCYENKYPNEVKYYEVSNAEKIPACDGSARMVLKSNGGNNIEDLSGAGGWVASPSELLRFMASIDGTPGIPDILKPETIAAMTQYVKDALPIGWIDITPDGEWSRTGTLAGTSALMKKQKDGYSWVVLTNTSSWKGSKFPHEINNMINRAMSTVPVWPDRDLFQLQLEDSRQTIAVR